MAFFKINSVSTLLKLPTFLVKPFVNFGYQPDPPDSRDYSFSDSVLNKNVNVNEISIKQYFKDVSNQYSVGSCTANGTADACEAMIALKKNVNPSQVPDLSRLFIYYNARSSDTPPTTGKDGGSKIRFAFDSIKRWGVCNETTWSYNTSKVNVQPGWLAYKEAIQNKITAFYRINVGGEEKIQQIKNALAQNHPTVFGTSVTDSFRRCNSDKVIRIPQMDGSDPFIGAHCMVVVGYSASKEAFLVRNSWGVGWGVEGYCFMHQDYIEGLASDLWVPTV